MTIYICTLKTRDLNKKKKIRGYTLFYFILYYIYIYAFKKRDLNVIVYSIRGSKSLYLMFILYLYTLEFDLLLLYISLL